MEVLMVFVAMVVLLYVTWFLLENIGSWGLFRSIVGGFWVMRKSKWELVADRDASLSELSLPDGLCSDELNMRKCFCVPDIPRRSCSRIHDPLCRRMMHVDVYYKSLMTGLDCQLRIHNAKDPGAAATAQLLTILEAHQAYRCEGEWEKEMLLYLLVTQGSVFRASVIEPLFSYEKESK